MKRIAALVLALCFALAMAGCGKGEASAVETIEGYKTYCRMSDGTWKCGDVTYKYRLEISGRVPNAAKDSTFVYLSNMKEISFDRAWKAAGLSSDSGDYFPVEKAVLVELRQAEEGKS